MEQIQSEVVYGQIVAKANHYKAVPGKDGTRRIIKDNVIRRYEASFREQCVIYRNKGINCKFILYVRVYHSSERYDIDNSLKTLLDCLEDVGAITNDKLCYKVIAEKTIDRNNPRIQFAIAPIEEQLNLSL